ncbi:MAG: protoheme IX farnesyltransferase [Verrucomicrobia bacterium]|nr:protoheme IX farnesyltransferase [Verrucomicrobiota bacterium]
MDTPPSPPGLVHLPAAPAPALPLPRLRAAAWFALVKPRLAAASTLTALAAYGAARPGWRPAEFLFLAIGTAAAAAGALALNQWLERAPDARMRRTRDRPLPRGELTAEAARTAGLLLGTGGVAVLAAGVNAAAALLAAATIAIYTIVYTPLKRRTRWATEVGAVSGALPALLGGAAAGDPWSPPAVALAALLWCWQLPHFFALGWRHRRDYRAAGFALLPAVDPTGARTAAWSFRYTVALLAASLLPVPLGAGGPIYLAGALPAGLLFGRAAARFLRAPGARDEAAGRLFGASLVYLPVILIALLMDRLVF